jgi:phenylalanyl-tRNA synthetase beta chain
LIRSRVKQELRSYSTDDAFFPGRVAKIFYREPHKHHTKLQEIKSNVEAALHTSTRHDIELGILGILHPTVLEKFEIQYPCSAVEFSLEPFKKQTQKVWTNEDWP